MALSFCAVAAKAVRRERSSRCAFGWSE
jgi:hypothetical protein